MGLTLHDRLLKRELGGTTRYSKLRGIYGDRQWIDDLDIVNELDGHDGCVNALRSSYFPLIRKFQTHIITAGQSQAVFSHPVPTTHAFTFILICLKTVFLNST